MDNTHAVLLMAVTALVTMGLRFLPFLIFREGKKAPALLTYLGKVLPFAIMGMLVVYCLKGIRLTEAPYGIPELLGCAIVALGNLLQEELADILEKNRAKAIYDGFSCGKAPEALCQRCGYATRFQK